MADLQTPNWKPYEQTLWQEAEHRKETYWHHQKPQFAAISDPLYGLRLSVLKNGQGDRSCPMRFFVYDTLSSLREAVAAIKDTFGGAFPVCTIQMGGRLEDDAGARTTDEAVLGAVEDGRTESVVLNFDTQEADESWKEFLGQLKKLEESWSVLKEDDDLAS